MYNQKNIAIKFFLLVVLFFVSAVYSNADILDEIKQKQGNIKTVRANFDQEKHTEILDKPIISKGIFYYMFPNNMRWEYKEALTVIYDGETLYLYYPDMKEADKIKNISRYPFLASFEISKLGKDYEVSHKKDKSGTTVNLKPKTSMPITSIEMFFKKTDAFPEKITIKEKYGDKTVIKFSNVVFNVNLSEELFKFAPTSSIKIREKSF